MKWYGWISDHYTLFCLLRWMLFYFEEVSDVNMASPSYKVFGKATEGLKFPQQHCKENVLRCFRMFSTQKNILKMFQNDFPHKKYSKSVWEWFSPIKNILKVFENNFATSVISYHLTLSFNNLKKSCWVLCYP